LVPVQSKRSAKGAFALSVKGAASLNVGHITINTGGTLELHDEIFNGAQSDIDLTTTGIDINGGSLLIGDAACHALRCDESRGISRPCGQNAPVHAHFSELRDWLAEKSEFEF
jgi:hypothetical protein